MSIAGLLSRPLLLSRRTENKKELAECISQAPKKVDGGVGLRGNGKILLSPGHKRRQKRSYVL
jgi:hypothetical protein